MTRRKDGRWQQKKVINGRTKVFYSTAPTEKKALRDIEQQIYDYLSESHEQKHNFLRIAEAMLVEREQNVRYQTMQSYIHSLKHLSIFFDMNIEDISPYMLQNLLNSMATHKYSQSAISKVKITFGLVLNHAILSGLPLTNYVSAVKLPKNVVKNKVTSVSDLVISQIIKNANTVKFGMWALTMLCTGARRGELAAIQRKDINFKQGYIRIWRSVEFINNQAHLKEMPKTENSVRNIPILDILMKPLKCLCHGMAPDDFIFGGDKPLSETMIKKRWKSYCKELNIDIHQHQLRHSYAKLLYRSGVDPKTAQGLLGHSDIRITMNLYTDFSEDVVQKSANKINNFMAEICNA